MILDKAKRMTLINGDERVESIRQPVQRQLAIGTCLEQAGEQPV